MHEIQPPKQKSSIIKLFIKCPEDLLRKCGKGSTALNRREGQYITRKIICKVLFGDNTVLTLSCISDNIEPSNKRNFHDPF